MNAKIIAGILVALGSGFALWFFLSEKADEHGKAAYKHTENIGASVKVQTTRSTS